MAQAISYQPPPAYSSGGITVPPPVNFGSSIAILSDIDGGGRRDLLVGAPGDGTGPTGKVFIISAEGPQAPNASAWIGPQVILGANTVSSPSIPANGVQFGYAVLNIGNIDSDPADDFAISAPSVPGGSPGPQTGLVFLMSIRPAISGGYQIHSLGVLSGTQDFGTSMTMVNTPSGRQLAVGVPALDEIHLFDLAQPVLPGTAPTRILNGGGRTGSLGWRLAAGPETTPSGAPSYVLAAGSPSYSSSQTNPQAEGYVAIYDLGNSALNSPTSFLYRGIGQERFGSAVTSIGFLAGQPSSPLPDFAVLGRGNFNSVAAIFHTPSTIGTQPTQNLAYDDALNGSFVISDGHMASTGDIDGDGFDDFAVAVGGQLRVYSTAGNVLTQITTTGASTSSGLVSGPDLFQTGARDLIVGPAFQTPNPQNLLVRVLPIGTSSLLPNPPLLKLSTELTRPIINFGGGTNTYTLTVEYSGPGNPLVFLLGDVAPVTPYAAPAPIGAGLGYVGLGTSVTLGVGTVSASAPLTFNIPMPTSGAYQSGVFQAVALPATGPWIVSNGVLGRYGMN